MEDTEFQAGRGLCQFRLYDSRHIAVFIYTRYPGTRQALLGDEAAELLRKPYITLARDRDPTAPRHRGCAARASKGERNSLL